MTVLLVLATFLVFALVDYLLNREAAPVAQLVTDTGRHPVAEADYVDGFQVPSSVRYHPGHGWLTWERKRLARVGVDEFAALLAGKVDSIELPKPGQWIRQGQSAWTLRRGQEQAVMASPIEGEVVEINPEIVKDPSLLRRDPYGKGWLMTVHVPDDESTVRNLVPVHFVTSWMQEVVSRLYAMQPQLAGAVAADGGRPVDDIAAALPGVSWKDLTSEFFLT